jgi:CheY-like chemotaxis protein
MPKVLVVDDNLSVRRVVEKALEGRRLEVLSAASGAEAMERIERERPDLVVCDVLLPDRDGYQVCQFVRTRPETARTPVLLISGVVNSTVLARAAEVQSSDVMFKPFAADELVRKIDRLLEGPVPAPAPAAGAGAREPGADPPPAAAPALDAIRVGLDGLAAAPEVRFAALVDREGFLIESAGDLPVEPDVAGALASCLAESSEGIGRELGQGRLVGVILEYEGATLLLHGVGSSALLAVVAVDATALGKVRYCIKKALPDLERAL